MNLDYEWTIISLYFSPLRFLSLGHMLLGLIFLRTYDRPSLLKKKKKPSLGYWCPYIIERGLRMLRHLGVALFLFVF
jgi:hypothetical protein